MKHPRWSVTSCMKDTQWRSKCPFAFSFVCLWTVLNFGTGYTLNAVSAANQCGSWIQRVPINTDTAVRKEARNVEANLKDMSSFP